jgi:hypothetical protein
MIDFILLFFKFLVVLTFFYFSGKLVRSFFAFELKVELFETFFNVLVGLLLSTVLYALIKSSLVTSLIISLPIFLYFFRANNLKFKKFSWTKIEVKKEILPFLILSSIVFLYQSYSYFDFTNFNIKYLFIDNYTYANVVSILHDFGVENVDYALDKFEPDFRHQSMPYRYADLWMSSFIMDVVQVSDIESFYLIVLPIFISLSGYFYYLLLVEKTSGPIKSILISFVLLFVSIAFIPFLNSGEKLPFISETTIMGTFQQKLSFSAVFFLLGIYFWKINRENALLFIMVVPIFYVAYLPAIWGGVFVYLSIVFMKNKWNVSFNLYHIRLLFLLTIVLILYWMFYKINGSYFLTTNKMKLIDVPLVKRLPKEIIDGNTVFRWKSFVSNFVYYSIPEIFIYLRGAIGNLLIGACFYIPLLTIGYLRFKRYYSEFLFVFITLTIGLIFTIYKDGDYNNYQFFTNCLLLISILISVSFIQNFDNSRKNYLFILIVILVNVIPVFSFKSKVGSHKINYKFTISVSTLISCKKEKNVLCFATKESFDGSFYSWVGGNILFPIKQISDQRIVFSIANPEVFFEKHSKSDLDYSYDWNLIPNWKRKYPNKTLKDFIVSNKIKYFLFYPNVKIPNHIRLQIKSVLKSNSYQFIEVK